MIRQLFLFLVAVFALLSPATANERPNILFLFSDDQAVETIGAYGLADIDTPNLDRLVAEGVSFTRAYNMGSWSGAVCVASRHMLNTGAFLWRAQAYSESLGKNGKASAGMPDLEEKGEMWSQLMAKAGYDTYFTGKWHVKADATKIFDLASNVRGGMPKDVEEGYNRPVQGLPDPWSPSDPKHGGFWEGGRHWSEVVADDAESFLRLAAESENPFFMYVAFNAPHDPRQAPKEYIDRYPLDRIAVPENFLPEYPYKDGIDNRPSLRDERLAPFPRTEFAVQVHRQEYFAIVSHMDAQIGRILDALEKSGKRDNTWIFFTSDHGLAVGRHGLFGKQNLFEHSTRVPLLMIGPGVAAGESVEEPVYLQDVMPTTLELAGADRPAQVEFRSLIPVSKGAKGYDGVYGAYLESQRSITTGNWKLVLYPKVPKVLLFDLESDPLEANDVSGVNPEKVSDLFGSLLKLQAEMGDGLDLAKSFPDLAGR